MIPLFLLGLTGPTGAGKSSVAKILEQKGYRIIDGDEIAREIMEPGSPVLPRLQQAFGEDILFPDGSLDRKKLAGRAFASPERTRRLNQITHPEIYKICEIRAQEAACSGYTKAVVDAAALFESGGERMCQAVLVVLAPKNLRKQRVLARDGVTEEMAELRMNAQQSDAFYRSRTPYVLFNDETEDLVQSVEKVMAEIESEQKRKQP